MREDRNGEAGGVKVMEVEGQSNNKLQTSVRRFIRHCKSSPWEAALHANVTSSGGSRCRRSFVDLGGWLRECMGSAKRAIRLWRPPWGV